MRVIIGERRRSNDKRLGALRTCSEKTFSVSIYCSCFFKFCILSLFNEVEQALKRFCSNGLLCDVCFELIILTSLIDDFGVYVSVDLCQFLVSLYSFFLNLNFPIRIRFT